MVSLSWQLIFRWSPWITADFEFSPHLLFSFIQKILVMWRIPWYWTRNRAQARQPRHRFVKVQTRTRKLVRSRLSRPYLRITTRAKSLKLSLFDLQFYIGGLRTFPGFMIPLGSKACFTAHIMSTDVGPNISSKRMIFPENWTRFLLVII